jgi:DNA replication protein DnaC
VSCLEGESHSIYRLPKKFWHCTFSSFDWTGKEKLKGILEEFACKVLEGQKPPPHLLMLGPQGRGKTHLGVAFYRWYIYHRDASKALWLNVPTFCDEVKSKFNIPNFDTAAFWKEIGDAEFLVLDDLLARDLSPWELENIIFKLINLSYNNEQVLVLTDNNDIKGISKVLRKHESSRILEGAIPLDFANLPDYRLKNES